MKKILFGMLCVGVLFFGASAFMKIENDSFEIIKNLEIFSNLYQELNSNYVDRLDPGELMHIGIEAMLKSLDPYTRYISEADIENHRIHSEGNYEGFGGRIKKIGDYATIVEVYENSPAHKSGLIAGDKIVAIEEVDVTGRSASDIKDIMNGHPSSELTISAIRYGESEPQNFVLNKKEISVKNVPYYGMIDGDVGYIVLTTFTPNAAKNVRGALAELKTQHPDIKGVILDLRDNGGGLLSEAIGIAGVFLPKGSAVVTTKNKIGSLSKSYDTRVEPLDEDINLAVLINENSASASEIVAGVVQDYDRGVLVGQRSFGKGLVQVYKQLKYKTQLKLTISKYFVPSGRCIQSVRYDADGNPISIPDEERNTFKTKNGRTVLDGGGIAPDIEIDNLFDAPYIKHLQDEEVFMFYATKYYLEKGTDSIPQDFKFTEIEDFKDFAKEFKYAKDFAPKRDMRQLKKSLGQSYDFTQFGDDFKALETKIATMEDELINTYEEPIKDIITKEIVSRYGFRSAVIENGLSNDEGVQKALDILRDDRAYNRILKK